MAEDRESSSENDEIQEESPVSQDEEETPKRKRRKRKVDYQFNGLSDLSFKEQVVLIKSYLKEKTYPAGCSQSFRRSLRRRTKAFRMDPRSEDILQYGKIEHGLPKPRWLEVIGDPEQQKEILRTTHISSEDGHHYGRDITHKKVTERFYWQTVGQDCINYVRSCTVCQSNAMNRSKESSAVGWSPAKTGKVQFGSGVWKQAGVTILGPYQRTFRDNKYLVVLWDYFTKWPEAQALPYMSSLLIARFIYSVMTRLGWVRITFYDESPELVQEIQDDFCEVSRTSQTFHVADRPEDVSLDEPYNSSLMEAFVTLTKTHPENWDQHIEWALYQYRTTKHPVMGYAPFQLIYGRAPYDPSNMDNCETYEDHVQEAGEKKRALIKDARRILGNARLRHHRRLKRIDESSNQTTQSQDSPPTTQQPQPQPQQQHQQPTRQQQQQQQQQHQQQQQQQHQALQQPPPRLPVQRHQPQGAMPRHQPPPQHQQQQQPPHQHSQPPPMSQPPAPPPLHQPMAYQHPDHTHMQPQVLSGTYTYMDLPALPCT